MKKMYGIMKRLHKAANTGIKIGGIGFIACALAGRLAETSAFDVTAGIMLFIAVAAILFYIVEYTFYGIFGEDPGE